MLHVTVNGETFKYEADKLLNTEAIALQKVTGMRMPEWTKNLQDGDAYALTGLIWLLWRRNGRDTPFDEVEFDLGSLDIRDDDDEPEAEADPTVAEVAPEVETSMT